ncbi:MAG: MutS-related protein [Tissierella sp.]|uniref:MutS-related protein n=1 Tax=Tissierella sp. TaxID=41274 RepID=UPI003F9ACC03
MSIAGILLGIQYEYIYFLISLIGLVALVYIDIWEKKELVRISKEKLREKWGKEHNEKRDFSSIRKIYDFLKNKENIDFVIDDITWRDLNMDLVFSKVDHTKSLPGVQCFYDLLRKPLFDEKELKERNSVINSLLYEKEIVNEIQYPLSLLGKKDCKEIFKYFENGMNIDTKYLSLYRIMSVLPIIGATFFLINSQLALITLFTSIIINAIIYQRNKNKVYREIAIFKYTGALIKTAKDIVKVDTDGLDIEKEELKGLIKSTKKIYKNISSLIISEENMPQLFQILYDYINMLILRETITFYKTVKQMDKQKEDILKIYIRIGKLDSYIAIASYKDGLDFFTEPELIDDKGFFIEVEELYHPLLEKPVPYSFKLDNIGALVTGSNASGKSTYLRTIGINTLFAQTFYIALAKKYCANYYRLLTSIGTTDSIEEGDSYFMSEAKSLKRIVDSLDDKLPVLCILDEIFRGTNTAERISAAREVLDYMIDRNTLVVAATRDIELTTMVNKSFHNYHFKESIEENDITFDYLLRHGPATSRNAIAILRYLGYPKMIYEKADKRVEEYEEKGSFY